MRFIPVFCAAAALLHAQNFDVATVKPAEPSPSGMIRIGMNGGPGTPDPGRLTYTNVALKQVLTAAFGVKEYQITGPAWLDSERFDITAKVPPGTTKEQMQVMLQNLLADRFKMTFHREKKEMNSYVLTVGKNGSKLKVADPEPPADPNAPAEPRRPLPEPGGRGPMAMGKDGFPEMPKGLGGKGGGPMMMMMPGKAKMVCARCSISRLADTLSSQLGKPVVDMTDLKDNYEFTLIFEPDMSGMKSMMVMAGGGRGPGGPPAASDGPAPAGNDDTAPPLLSAIQDQLGLKLDPKKAPVDLIVLERIEKTPTDN